MPTSSAATSPRSRRGIAFKTLRCLCEPPALPRGCRKQFRDSCKQSIMAVGDYQIDVGCSSRPQVLQEASPSILAFLRTGAPRQNLFVSCQVHSQGRQNDGGIGLVPMTNAEMHAIQVQN